MSDRSRHDYRSTELDQDLLATPFKVQTNWHVITGAACSGKTTLIDLLADKGFRTTPETARVYFDSEVAKGRSITDVRADRAYVTRQVYARMVECERGLHPADVTFLDRALPDAPAFFRLAGLDPNEILPDFFHSRYTSVFILKRFPFQKDGIRAADDATADFESWLFRDYSALGYKAVWVPVLPPEERLAFVLDRLFEQGLL
jgi:predicted ATPase